MIYKRAVAKLRAQDWSAIVIEFAIVVFGVFVGTWVANLNQERTEIGETRQMLRNIQPELQANIALYESIRHYYVLTRRYATTAYAGWRGDRGVSDRDFVIAAYQASQNDYSATNGSSWSAAFGSDRLRNIADPQLRHDVGQLMSIDYNVIEQEIFTDYRRHVRQVIPEDIQDAIRAECGDRRDAAGAQHLPEACSLQLPADRFADAAKALRAHPELVGELRWHFAAVATYLNNLELFETVSRHAIDRIGTTT